MWIFNGEQMWNDDDRRDNKNLRLNRIPLRGGNEEYLLYER